jgi:uncharacterized protein (TIGR02996 family)
MTDLDVLLGVCIERPDDNTPRLVFGDKLEDTGNANWANIIRKQIEETRRDRAKDWKDETAIRMVTRKEIKNLVLQDQWLTTIEKSINGFKYEGRPFKCTYAGGQAQEHYFNIGVADDEYPRYLKYHELTFRRGLLSEVRMPTLAALLAFMMHRPYMPLTLCEVPLLELAVVIEPSFPGLYLNINKARVQIIARRVRPTSVWVREFMTYDAAYEHASAQLAHIGSACGYITSNELDRLAAMPSFAHRLMSANKEEG